MEGKMEDLVESILDYIRIYNYNMSQVNYTYNFTGTINALYYTTSHIHIIRLPTLKEQK